MPDAPPSLDGRLFDMVSSTASTVDADNPTRFQYHECDGLIWGEYTGDTVRLGRFVGARSADAIEIQFGHVVADTGRLVTGGARSVLRVGEDSLLELVETFGDGGGEQSVCREVRIRP